MGNEIDIHAPGVEMRKSLCYFCHANCGVLAYVKDGEVIKIEGDPNYANQGGLCCRGNSALLHLNHPARINHALKRVGAKGEGKWEKIPYDQAIAEVADHDAYNWGYDPLHWGAPEGSYATEGHQDGGARVVEFREMVGALHDLGLQVVLDQVYNHTAACGQDPRSVLDRVVPGYYHRLDAVGRVTSSTCCANTATENALCARLMVDSVVRWARWYRVDGFRFDLKIGRAHV